MGNMSYCRFENTLEDLRDCKDALDEGALNNVMGVSGFEREAMRNLIALCQDIADEYGEDTEDKDE
jgi:endonuclease III